MKAQIKELISFEKKCKDVPASASASVPMPVPVHPAHVFMPMHGSGPEGAPPVAEGGGTKTTPPEPGASEVGAQDPPGLHPYRLARPGDKPKPSGMTPLFTTVDLEDGTSIFKEVVQSGESHRVNTIGAEKRDPHKNFILGQMVRETAVPKFSGEVCDFEHFRWAFTRYIGKLEQTQGQQLDEDIKVFILEKALPPYETKWLQQMLQEGQKITCQGFLAKLEAKFGATRESQVRQKWESLKCQHDGKMTAFDMQKFELEFKQLRKELPIIHDEEVHRHLMRRLPGHMVNWVTDEEARLKADRPRVVWTTPGQKSNAEIAASVLDFIGEMPEKVHRVQPKVFVITFGKKEGAKKMLDLNGMQLETGETLHIRPEDHHMSLDEVFSFLTHRLECRDKVDSYLRTPPQQNNRWRSNRDPRYVRITDVDTEQSETDEEEESEEDEDRPRGRSRDRRYRKSRSVSPVAAEQKRSKSAPARSEPARPPTPPPEKPQPKAQSDGALSDGGKAKWQNWGRGNRNGNGNGSRNNGNGSRNGGNGNGNGSGNGNRNGNGNWKNNGNGKGAEALICGRCKKIGHYASHCYTNMNNPRNREFAGWPPDDQNGTAQGQGKGKGGGQNDTRQNNGQNWGRQNWGQNRGRGGNRSWGNGGRGKGNSPPPRTPKTPRAGAPRPPRSRKAGVVGGRGRATLAQKMNPPGSLWL